MCQHGEMRRSGERRKQERLLQRKNQNAKNWYWLFEEGESFFASYSAGLFLKIRRAKKVP